MLYDESVRAAMSRIEAACRRSGRSPGDVAVVGVSKYVGVPEARELLASGIAHLGENRWQNAREKWEAIGEDAVWHFIGHLQTNKVKDVIGRFDYIHSLDRVSLLNEIHKCAAQRALTVNAFVQVNVSGEETKYGLEPEQLFAFAEQAAACRAHVRVVGLMTMAPHDEDPEAARPVFRQLRRLRDELNSRALLPEPVAHLSMGMSGDFETAVEEGATWLRLGSVLLGG